MFLTIHQTDKFEIYIQPKRSTGPKLLGACRLNLDGALWKETICSFAMIEFNKWQAHIAFSPICFATFVPKAQSKVLHFACWADRTPCHSFCSMEMVKSSGIMNSISTVGSKLVRQSSRHRGVGSVPGLYVTESMGIGSLREWTNFSRSSVFRTCLIGTN